MGVYLIKCDAQKTREQWTLVVQSGQLALDIAIPAIKIAQNKSTDDPRTWFSLQLKPMRQTRTFCLVALAIGLSISELFVLVYSHFLDWLFTSFTEPSLIRGILGVLPLLLGLIPTCSPFIVLGLYYFIGIELEHDFFKNIENSGIEAHVVADASHWLLFPQDIFIMQWGTFAVVGWQLLASLNMNITPFILPPLFFGAITIVVGVIKEYAKRETYTTSSALPYWKLTLVNTNRVLFLFFLLPLGLLWIIYESTRIHIASAYATLPSNGNLTFQKFAGILLNFDVDSILKHASIRDLDTIINYTYSHSLATVPLSFVVIILTVSLPLLFVRSLRSQTFTMNIVYEQEIKPFFASSKLAGPSSSTKINMYIVVNYLSLLVLLVPCLMFMVLTILWIYNRYATWLPVGLVAPLVWYHTLVGRLLGEPLFYGLLLCLFASVLFWLFMWFYSLTSACWQLVVTTPRGKSNTHRAKSILHDLCKDQGIRPPLLHIDEYSASWPITTPILPFSQYCIIRVSNALVNELTDEQLKLILAHELAHVTTHVKKLWLLQVLSRLSFIGSGYLTLLMDYWTMELEADDFAASIMGNSHVFAELLEAAPDIELRANLQLLMATATRTNSTSTALKLTWFSVLQKLLSPFQQLHSGKAGKLVNGVAAVYTFHFGNTLWGTLHPDFDLRASLLSLSWTYHTFKVFTAALLEKNAFQHTLVAPEHILLGFLCEEQCGAAKILRTHKLRLDKVREAIETVIGYGSNTNYDDWDFSPETDEIQNIAREAADGQGHTMIDTVHLLFGLLQIGNSVATAIMKEVFEVDLEKLEKETIAALQQKKII